MSASLALAILAGSAGAPTELPDNPVVDAAVAAIERGEVEELRNVFSNVHSMLMIDMAVDTPVAALDLLSGCVAKEVKRMGFPAAIFYRYEWTCEDGQFFAGITVDDNGKSLSFFDVTPLDEYNETIALPMRPPPSPALNPMSSEERARRVQEREQQLAERKQKIGSDFKAAGFDALTSRMSATTQITTSFFNPFLKQDFLEEKGYGPAAFASKLNHFARTFGSSESAKCDVEPHFMLCTWKYAEPGNTLVALISTASDDPQTGDWRIGHVEIRYTSAEKLAEAARRYQD